MGKAGLLKNQGPPLRRRDQARVEIKEDGAVLEEGVQGPWLGGEEGAREGGTEGGGEDAAEALEERQVPPPVLTEGGRTEEAIAAEATDGLPVPQARVRGVEDAAAGEVGLEGGGGGGVEEGKEEEAVFLPLLPGSFLDADAGVEMGRGRTGRIWCQSFRRKVWAELRPEAPGFFPEEAEEVRDE